MPDCIKKKYNRILTHVTTKKQEAVWFRTLYSIPFNIPNSTGFCSPSFILSKIGFLTNSDFAASKMSKTSSHYHHVFLLKKFIRTIKQMSAVLEAKESIYLSQAGILLLYRNSIATRLWRLEMMRNVVWRHLSEMIEYIVWAPRIVKTNTVHPFIYSYSLLGQGFTAVSKNWECAIFLY